MTPLTRWVCAYCVATKGLRGSDAGTWPAWDDEEAQARHVESEHHIPVRRDHETAEQTTERFRREQPEAGGPNCRCPSCSGKREVFALVDSVRRAGAAEGGSDG